MSSSLPLSFRLPPSGRHHFDLNFTPFSLTTRPPSRSFFKPHLCFSISPSSSSNYDNEEARWLREEQRWLREEKRWLREESRWNAERESLIREISSLKLRIQELETRGPLQGPTAAEAMTNIAALLQVLKKEVDLGNTAWIAEKGTSVVPIVLEAKSSESVKVEEVVKEVVTVPQRDESGEKKDEKKKKRETLRMGSEGVDVKFLQEALQILGFYSGEEDMEYSSFSSGTDRAVKTWQASVGIPEDGIMTSELQERLFTPQQTEIDPKVNNLTPLKKEPINGAAISSATEIDISQHRVYLLGENRWEEPSRLTGRNKKSGRTNTKDSTTTCIQCRGEGRLLCSECDGTGEPNLEPQFTEWIEEGTKCPYCEGHGFTVCDLCEGKTTG